MKKFIVCLIPVIAGALAASGSSALAASSSSRLIDDAVFDNTTTMTASQIDTFLNGFPGSCISTNSGFTAPDPTGYSPLSSNIDGKYTYGSPVSAGQVIYDAAIANQINPQVLLTKLQNEELLINGNAPSGYSQGCNDWQFASATGYNCPDTVTEHAYTYNGNDPYSDSSALQTPLYYRNGNPVNSVTNTCVNKNYMAGFSEQVIRTAWLLSFSRHHSEGQTWWAAINGNWNHCDDNNTCAAALNIPSNWACYSGLMTQGNYKRCPTDTSTASYDGYANIDNQSLLMSTGGTAALYVYTPHIQSFDSIFESWFGPATGPAYSATYDSESGYTIINSGVNVSVFIRFKNTGYNFWKDDQSTFSGWNPIHLAVSNPINKKSSFAAGNWLSPSRPTGIIYKVYNADGSLDTVPADQHTVRPGQIGEFAFTLYANPSIPGGVYREYFQPVVEGSSNWNMGAWAYLDIGINVPNYKASWIQNSPTQTINKGSSGTISFVFKNVGTDPWFDDHDLPPGVLPIHLATSNPINRIDDFGSTWPSKNRPLIYPATANGFSRVYDTGWNGDTGCNTIATTCLANNWHTVKVGQYAQFDIPINVPAGEASKTYQEYFQLVQEGAPGLAWNIPFNNVWLPWTGVTVP
ncbi:MAG TPA: hypothetical protein VFP35_02340 [Candidatus Saccharimonadales bacterium]|nr:hypothetical protein [Candidatus Saccharimonadales bacterium]